MMDAMMIDRICDLAETASPLTRVRLPIPEIGDRQILIKVKVCGVCHTELDEIEGRTPPHRLPMVPGHQVVGRVADRGAKAQRFAVDERVGVAWIYSACGKCGHCRNGLENLCPDFRATGRDAHGGYAEYMAVDEDFAYAIDDRFSDAQAAPLLCAGAIGYRSLRLTGLEDGERLGLTGFGASAHLVLKMAKHQFPRSPIYVFARSPREQDFARELGARWAGDTRQVPPEKLHCMIDTTPAWLPVIHALKNLLPGGRLVINAIRKESADRTSLLDLRYEEHLWQEKMVKSVANITRQDVREFLALAARIPIEPSVQTYEWHQANKALLDLKQHKIRGAKVLVF